MFTWQTDLTLVEQVDGSSGFRRAGGGLEQKTAACRRQPKLFSPSLLAGENGASVALDAAATSEFPRRPVIILVECLAAMLAGKSRTVYSACSMPPARLPEGLASNGGRKPILHRVT